VYVYVMFKTLSWISCRLHLHIIGTSLCTRTSEEKNEGNSVSVLSCIGAVGVQGHTVARFMVPSIA
jgi:hypothetical protein